MSSKPSLTSSTQMGNKEFIALMAVIMSLMAMAIDSMLPALAIMGESLNVQNTNDTQFIIISIFLGMSMGLMLYGPFSDAFGRKKAVYLGISIFVVGDLISLFASDFSWMIIGRLLQGFGGAACRVMSITMIRDKFSGKEMARVMSLIMVIFIMVSALAPSFGQVILFFAPWQAIFVWLLIFALIGVTWLALRQEETLPQDKRIAFNFHNVWAGIKETLLHPSARPYTFASGIMFGALVGYISSAQQILQVQYQLGDLFTVYFGVLALAFGMSSYANSRLVMIISMESLCKIALLIIALSSLGFYFYAQSLNEQPPIMNLMVYLTITLFSFGVLFGNFNTLAVQSLGHIAGVANSVISTVSNLVSVSIGAVIGLSYDGTIMPIIVGFGGCGLVTLLIVYRVPKSAPITA